MQQAKTVCRGPDDQAKQIISPQKAAYIRKFPFVIISMDSLEPADHFGINQDQVAKAQVDRLTRKLQIFTNHIFRLFGNTMNGRRTREKEGDV
jgi:hypothetical protein